MTDFLLVGTREAGTTYRPVALDAKVLADAGHQVVLFLVQDGVVDAVASGDLLSEPIRAGVRVWADTFSLARRSLRPADLVSGVVAVDMPHVVDVILEAGCRVVWC